MKRPISLLNEFVFSEHYLNLKMSWQT